MGVPLSKGSLRTKIDDMLIGDYIVCNYTATSGAVGTFSNFGGTAGTEIPLANSINSPNGSFYLIKADKGLLIADRVIQTNITWDTLNTGKVVQGKPQTFNQTTGIIRCLTGGVAYANTNGNSSTAKSVFGNFPKNNEWDKYIVNSTLNGTIKAGDIAVWNYNLTRSWVQETPILAINPNTYRMTRGYTDTVYDCLPYISTSNNGVDGFRPCFEYVE